MTRFREVTLLIANAQGADRADRVTFTPGALVGDVSATKRHAHAAVSQLARTCELAELLATEGQGDGD